LNIRGRILSEALEIAQARRNREGAFDLRPSECAPFKSPRGSLGRPNRSTRQFDESSGASINRPRARIRIPWLTVTRSSGDSCDDIGPAFPTLRRRLFNRYGLWFRRAAFPVHPPALGPDRDHGRDRAAGMAAGPFEVADRISCEAPRLSDHLPRARFARSKRRAIG
jgi:hypothetical protein